MRETALVTGASSGIGEQFAHQLAARGHDLVLVARRADRLEGLAAELPTEAHVIPCDLATDAASLPERVAELGVEVELLVNNAGFGTSGPFLDTTPGATPSRCGSTARRSSPSPTPSSRAWSSAGAAGSSTSPRPPACSRSPTSPSTRPPRRSRSASPTPCTRSCGAPASGSSPSTRARSRPSGSRSPATSRTAWASSPAGSRPSRSCGSRSPPTTAAGAR